MLGWIEKLQRTSRSCALQQHRVEIVLNWFHIFVDLGIKFTADL